MYTNADLQRILGLSRRQVNERLSAMNAVPGLLHGQVAKGPRNRMEYTVAVLEMMRDLHTLSERDGCSLSEAAVQLAQKIHGNGHRTTTQEAVAEPVQQGQDDVQVQFLQEKVRMLESRVEDLQLDRDRWRDMAERLALPAPRRSWWDRLRRR